MTFRVTILTLVLSLILATPVLAQDKKPRPMVKGPHGAFADSPGRNYKSDRDRITRYRRQQMRAISGNYRSLEAVIRYKAPFVDELNGHADALLDLARRIPKMFVKGTEMAPDKWGAKPAVWAEPSKFKLHYEGFERSIGNLKSAIAAGDPTEMERRLFLVRHECLACHKEFRVRRPRPK